MAITGRRLTLEEFLQLPEEEPALEYGEDGTVTQKVSPKTRHSALRGEICERINGFARPRRLARAFPELRATFGGASRVPNVSIFRWERIPVDEKGYLIDDVFVPPDIAVEIVSPGQRVNALVRRCLWYVANGVQIALLIDPADESVLSFRLGSDPRAAHDADPIDLSEVLPGFELTARELFSALRNV